MATHIPGQIAPLLDTVGDLRAALEGVPDDMPLVGDVDGSGRLVFGVDLEYGNRVAYVSPFHQLRLEELGLSVYNPLAL